MTKSVSIFAILTMTVLTSLGQTKKDSLYVFIGEKIDVKSWPQPRTVESIDTTIVNGDTTIMKNVSLSMDARFICRYKIMQQVFGTFKADTIEFLAFDHYGKPAFSKYKNVMLFVSNYNSKLYHEKYQYFDVYKTKNGRWASSYKVGDYEHDYNRNTPIKPELIDFAKKVSYNIKGRSKEDIEYYFPLHILKLLDKRQLQFGETILKNYLN